jgi:hypothetical protein
MFRTTDSTVIATTRNINTDFYPPIQWVPVALPLGVKRPVREADHSPASSAEVKEYAFMAWCLVKHGDNFTFTFYMKISEQL